jgi:hypothetical protein
VTDADASLAASEVAAAWEAHMRDLFDGATGRADQTARVLPEVFNLEDQLAAADDEPPSPPIAPVATVEPCSRPQPEPSASSTSPTPT